jgi:hypothetical protein
MGRLLLLALVPIPVCLLAGLFARSTLSPLMDGPTFVVLTVLIVWPCSLFLLRQLNFLLDTSTPVVTRANVTNQNGSRICLTDQNGNMLQAGPPFVLGRPLSFMTFWIGAKFEVSEGPGAFGIRWRKLKPLPRH